MHSLHSSKRRRGHSGRRFLERKAIWLLVLVAWSWVVGFFGVLFYKMNHLEYSSPPQAQLRLQAKQDVIRNYLHSAPKIAAKHDVFDTNAFPHLPPPAKAKYESPLLIFTCRRAEYLRETLQGVFDHLPNPCTFGCPIIVSQDGTDQGVADVIKEFTSKFRSERNVPVLHLQHEQSHGQDTGRRARSAFNPYMALAQHYGWALTRVFDNTFAEKSVADEAFPIPQRVVILEEDLRIAPDFFEYFAAMAPLLDQDSTLLAVSAFNDNGHRVDVESEAAAHRVLRSDFFPGLGWMMTRNLWKGELQTKWPQGYWDDWLRDPPQRKDRHILRPEISRTFHFGSKGGASRNQFGKTLTQVKLNERRVEWHKDKDAETAAVLSKVASVAEYDKAYTKIVSDSIKATSVSAAINADNPFANVRVEYRNLLEFQRLAKQLTLMSDEKAGVPRTAYRGIVETRIWESGQSGPSRILFLTPPESEWRSKMAI